MDFLKARAAHIRLGRRGENAACRLLRSKGLEILARDCRLPRGEIDIVARDGRTLVFVEVKTLRAKRRIDALRPAGNLSRRQMARIYRAAFCYMKEIGNPNVPFRFDLVEVVMGRLAPLQIRHWESHFGREVIERRHPR